MDRLMVYPGAIPLETDLLRTERHALIAIGALGAALFGSSTIANGLTVSPTIPASMSVQIGSGQIYSLQNLDSTAYSSLAADTAHQIVKQGINLDAVTIACAAPATAGYSINYLIEATFQEVDVDPVVLPYYNASNPSAAYSGPANSGSSQPTRRHGTVILTAKPGVAATSGSQTTPSADAGYIPLCVVTVAYGATTIGPSNISPVSNAPVVPAGGILAALQAVSYASRAVTAAGTSTTQGVTPDGLAQAIQGGSFLYAVGSNSATAPTASLAPAPAALQAGMEIVLKCSTTNTGGMTLNLNALGAAPVTYMGNPLPPGMMRAGQLYILIYDGSNWQLRAPSFHGIVAYQQGPTGYRVFSNGDVEQWGVTAIGSGSNNVNTQLNFPMSFPTAIFTIVGNADAGANQNWVPMVVSFQNRSQSGCTISVDCANNSQQIAAGRNIMWEARGN